MDKKNVILIMFVNDKKFYVNINSKKKTVPNVWGMSEVPSALVFYCYVSVITRGCTGYKPFE